MQPFEWVVNSTASPPYQAGLGQTGYRLATFEGNERGPFSTVSRPSYIFHIRVSSREWEVPILDESLRGVDLPQITGRP